MKIVRNIKSLHQYVTKNKLKSIGFVPTMGFLHDGHLSLVDYANKENDLVIMSIFVNPLQFGENEDFHTYPRNEERDIELAKKRGVDLLFIPKAEEIYPDETSILMKVTKRVDSLCGRSRPGHFDGVATIVAKLFNLIQPNIAYFGLKDAQQFAVIDSLVKDLNFPVKLVGIPTVREKDGLALSSRNIHLSEVERKEAIILFKALTFAQQLIKSGYNNVSDLIDQLNNYIKERASCEIDYIDILEYPKLEYIKEIEGQIIIAIAVRFDTVRLIDNIILNARGEQVTKFVAGASHLE